MYFLWLINQVKQWFMQVLLYCKLLKPYMDGEFVNVCCMQLKYSAQKRNFLKLPVTLLTAECVNNLKRDIHCQFKEKCKDFVTYSVEIEESKDITDIKLLAVFIHGVNKDLRRNF
jgi:hypothetical protein